jgi:hypothetical protein
MLEVEGEVHMLQCPAYIDIWQRYAGLFEGFQNMHMQFMNMHMQEYRGLCDL